MAALLYCTGMRIEEVLGLRWEDIELDPAAHSATRSGVPLRLSPTGFVILETLLRAALAVVPRTELEQAIWGDFPPDSDALQQALNEKRGSEVQLYVPQRGDKAHLVEMAHTNAVERLARESGRYAREEKLLDELAQVLGLAKPPRAIESYDISNWGDGSSVCGMVTFRDGKPYKAGYRRFKMKTVAGTDDYASLAETVSRRAAGRRKVTIVNSVLNPCRDRMIMPAWKKC